MDDKIRAGYLYDFYGELLNSHQREVFEMSIVDDLSLSEIADELSISRQAVHDLIKRCDKSLEEYESKLHLVQKFMTIKDNISIINDLTQGEPTEDTLKKIASISNQILEEL